MSQPMRVAGHILLFAAAAWIVLVAVQIEHLNARAGYKLPRDAETRESLQHGGSAAWRATRMDEQNWRRMFVRDAQGNPDPRPLTPEEDAQMRADVERQNANFALREAVGTLGCVQYPLILGVLIGGVKLARSGRGTFSSLLALVPVTLAVLALLLAIYRGYVRSLMD